jgi:hypothetical protein
MLEPVPVVVEDTVGRRRTKEDAPRRFLVVSVLDLRPFTVSAIAVGGGGATGGGGGVGVLGDDIHMVTGGGGVLSGE